MKSLFFIGLLIVGVLWQVTIVDAQETLVAFPGAEGFGKYATGGRGGRVIYVTTLEDVSTEGSLRYAINQTGARSILFKVSGTIKLKSVLNINNNNITIASQSAPGDGICLRDYPVVVNADNVIIRFMRFRMGDEAEQEGDALGGRFHKNIIVDHCSMSWSTDECVSFYQNENFTLQWCIISESLRNSVHEKGEHGYGGIWGGKYASFHHNLLAHHDSRNPRLGETKGEVFALTDLVDLRNNVIYNWQNNSCYGGEAMNANIVNCYYRPGPATTKIERIIAIDQLVDEGYPITGMWGKFYIDGNALEESERATNDNWTYGVYNQFHSKYGTISQADKDSMRLDEPLMSHGVTTHSAEIAYQRIIDYAGASYKRDAVDERIINDVKTKSATYMDGGNGSINGIIDTQTAVGGWPELQSETAPVDMDNDGMPDTWETAKNLNPNNSEDANNTSLDGNYTNLEVYLNSLVADIITNQNLDGTQTGVEEINFSNEFDKVSIKAIGQKLFLSHSKPLKLAHIYSLTGQLIQSFNLSDRNEIIQISGNYRGIYLVKVVDEDLSFSVGKVFL